MKDKVSQEHVCEEEVLLNNNIGKQSGNLVEMPSEVVEQGMDDHLPNEIDGAKEELENELTSREELAVLQVEFADMEEEVGGLEALEMEALVDAMEVYGG
nr:hypothetical protein [Tanacetum cinerariifolium]